MSSERNIQIHIKSIQTNAEGEKDTVEFYSEGRYVQKNGATYITYTESEISGMEGTTTTLKMCGDEIAIIRFGSVTSKLTFKNGAETHNKYQTPYGIFDMTIHTRELMTNFSETDRSHIYLRYLLDIDGQGDMMNELSLSFTYA